MGGRHADRLWTIGGVAIIVVLALISWFFLIKPKYAETDDVHRQAEDTQIQIRTLNKRIAELEKQKSKLSQYRSALKVSQLALPSTSGVPDLLRQLEKAGDDRGVKVAGFVVNGASAQKDVPNVFALPINVIVDGSIDNLGKFLTYLQQSQPRAVLINSVALTTRDDEEAADKKTEPQLTLSLTAFVAAAAGQAAPSLTQPTK
jgi:Tfp pilus assembly protein PilO